jgi:hypothetical protein
MISPDGQRLASDLSFSVRSSLCLPHGVPFICRVYALALQLVIDCSRESR